MASRRRIAPFTSAWPLAALRERRCASARTAVELPVCVRTGSSASSGCADAGAYSSCVVERVHTIPPAAAQSCSIETTSSSAPAARIAATGQLCSTAAQRQRGDEERASGEPEPREARPERNAHLLAPGAVLLDRHAHAHAAEQRRRAPRGPSGRSRRRCARRRRCGEASSSRASAVLGRAPALAPDAARARAGQRQPRRGAPAPGREAVAQAAAEPGQRAGAGRAASRARAASAAAERATAPALDDGAAPRRRAIASPTSAAIAATSRAARAAAAARAGRAADDAREGSDHEVPLRHQRQRARGCPARGVVDRLEQARAPGAVVDPPAPPRALRAAALP